jgi:threonine/homoserine/homoserine lactone efflux protein
MENLIHNITSNPVYLIITVLFIIFIVFAIFKKIFKLLLYAGIIFIGFLAYVHFTGGNVKNAINDTKEKGEQLLNKGKLELNENK